MPKQRKRNEQTGPEAAAVAGKLLKNPKTPKNVKKVAASDLTQAPPKPPKKAPPKKRKKSLPNPYLHY